MNKKIVVISNITLNPFLNDFIKKWNRESIKYINLNEIFDLVYVPVLQDSDIIILWIDFYNRFGYSANNFFHNVETIQNSKTIMVDYCTEMLNYVLSFSNGKVIWFDLENERSYKNRLCRYKNLEFNICDYINKELYELYRTEKIVFLNTKKIIHNIGLQKSYDNMRMYRWDCPYSNIFLEEVSKEIYSCFENSKEKIIKCLILDCDNVLWGGIIREDGYNNIKLGDVGIGRRYKEFQRALRTLYDTGVELAICSKNEDKDVREVFNNNRDMVLSLDMFATIKINYQSKINNILAIAEELSISISNMLFIDDSAYEIEAVKNAIKDVNVLQFNIYNWNIMDIGIELTEEPDWDTINKRHRFYKRKNKMEQKNNLEKLKVDLETKIDITKAQKNELRRISELSRRTNRLTNGIRYELSELNRILAQGGDMYSVYLSDQFGDLGLIGSFIIKENVLLLCCVSCRALGYNVEQMIMQYIKTNFKIKSINAKDTKKNDIFLKYINEELL